MSELTPITRVESYLDAIVNSGIPPTEDITRIETFLQAIYDNQVCALTPITRIEMFLGKISGQDIELPEPITRVELYLAAIAGEDVELPKNPITRLEMYLAEWADSGDWTTISGAIVEFITQRAHKLKSCVVSLSPIQDLSHGDPSPTNICPISGWTGCNVFRAGKNLMPYPYSAQSGTYNGVAFTINNDGSVTLSGTATAQVYFNLRNLADKFLLKAGSYIVSDAFTGLKIVVGRASNNTMLGRTDVNNGAFTLTDDTEAFAFIEVNNGATVNGTIKPMIRVATDTSSDYEPYNGDTYSVTWESEVFGGNYDFVSGKGKDGMGAVNFDDLSWSLVSSTYGRWAAIISDIKSPTDGATLLNALAEQYRIVTSNAYNNVIGTMYCVPNGTTINVCNGSTTDKPSGKFAYELATPTTTTITPTPITALKGYNAMWSDAGDIEVTVHGTPVEVETLQALNMLLGGAYRNNQTAEDVSDDEALEIILGGEQR